jgi:chemotaxis protein MotB
VVPGGAVCAEDAVLAFRARHELGAIATKRVSVFPGDIPSARVGSAAGAGELEVTRRRHERRKGLIGINPPLGKATPMSAMKSGITMTCVVLFATGCVSQGKYDDALKSANDARIAMQRASAEKATAERECEAQTARLAARATALQVTVDNQATANSELRQALKETGQSAEQLLSEKGSLNAELMQSRIRLEELRKAQAATDARAALYRQLALKMQRMIGAGEASISIRDGRMILSMPNDVLFDSGRTEIKKSGHAVLEEMAGILKTVPRQFQIAGHTDNVPINTERFPSNWELSTARAVEVIRFFIAQGVPPAALSGAGFGEYNPVASNDDEKGRRRNRRIEIVLQPQIDELVSVPNAN